MLNEFQNELKNILLSSDSLKTNTLSIKTLLERYVKYPQFKVDLISQIITQMEEKKEKWDNGPIFCSLEPAFSIRIIYWPPFYENNPHQHNTWSVTGVLLNQIQVKTFELENSNPLALKTQKEIYAEENQVGYILPPCIHNIKNDCSQGAVTIHLFGADENNNTAAETTIWFPSPRKGEVMKEVKNRALALNIKILAGIGKELVSPLLTKIYELSPLKLKLECVKGLFKIDKKLSLEKSKDLAKLLEGEDQSKLVRINAEVERSLGVQ